MSANNEPNQTESQAATDAAEREVVDGANGADGADGADGEETSAAAPDAIPPEVLHLRVEVNRLQSELQAKTARLDEVLRAYRRVDEEYKRSKERMERELRREVRSDLHRTLAKFFEVADNLGRSVEAAEAPGATMDALLNGLKLVHVQFDQTLEAAGVEEIPALGQPFDPDVHEAVGVVPVDSAEKHQTVVNVFRTGYRVGDTVIRPSMVQVGQHAG